MRVAELVWTSMNQLKHRFIVRLAVSRETANKERILKLHIQVDEANCCLYDAQVMETTVYLLFVD